jgi:hypothetical protein
VLRDCIAGRVSLLSEKRGFSNNKLRINSMICFTGGELVLLYFYQYCFKSSLLSFVVTEIKALIR